ncbi:MAG TPA: TPM domain-containing protein, partial [Flavisolibacter sp.]
MVLYFLRISSILLTCLLVAGSYARAQQATGSAGTTIKNDSTASGLGVIVMRTEISKNIPQVKGPVSDYGNVLTKEQIAEIDSLVRSIWAETKNEIYVSILDSSMTNTSDLPDFAEYMYFSWPYISRQRGVLIVLAPAIRRVRIVTG